MARHPYFNRTPYVEQGPDEGPAPERQRRRVGLHHRHREPGRDTALPPAPQHDGRDVESHRVRAGREQPARALRGAGADLEHPAACG